MLTFTTAAIADVIGEVKSCYEIKNTAKRTACYDSLANEVSNAPKKDVETEKITSAAKEPMKALRKLQSRVQTGISYKEYPSAVSDAKYEVTSYVREYGEKTPSYSKYLNDALTKYNDAVTAWNYKFESGRVEQLIWSIGTVNAFKHKYPELSAAETTGGLRIDSVLQILWGLASNDIDSAQSELSILMKK